MHGSQLFHSIQPVSPDYLAIKEGKGVKAEWIAPTPELIVGDVKEWAEAAEVNCARIPGYWMEKGGNKGKDVAPAAPGEKVLYKFHGGGYQALSAHPSDMTAVITSDILTYSKTINRAFSLEYRLTKPPGLKPAHPFPAALLDAIAGYDHLVNVLGFQPSNIIIEGDSAGANLALALTRYLLENQGRDGVKLPAPPGGLVLNSPWTDLTGSDHKDGGSPFTNRGFDFLDMFTAGFQAMIDKFLGGPTQRELANNPYISPGAQTAEMDKISFAGFPRTFITYGGYEVLLDQIVILKERMARDLGDEVQSYEMPEALHDPLSIPWFVPERSAGARKTAEWIDK